MMLIEVSVFSFLPEVYPQLFLRMDDEITSIIETLAIIHSSPELGPLRELLKNRRSVRERQTQQFVEPSQNVRLISFPTLHLR